MISSKEGGFALAFVLILLIILRNPSSLDPFIEIRLRSARSWSNLVAFGFNMFTCNVIIKYKNFAEKIVMPALQPTSGIAAGWDLKLVRQVQMLIKGTTFLF